jgi:hypothetical protein
VAHVVVAAVPPVDDGAAATRQALLAEVQHSNGQSMPQAIFATRNVTDKLRKVADNRDMLQFYWQTYILSRVESVEPDIYIVSYPKCGRTWFRIMLQKYFEFDGVKLQDFHDKSLFSIPNLYTIKFEHDQGNWVPAPLHIKQLSFNVSKYAHKKVIFLVRDPRDVLVSSWYHLRYRENIYQDDLSHFVRDRLTGIHKLVAFLNMWIEHRHVPQDFLLLTYEQMHADPFGTARQVLAFLNLDTDPERVRYAVEESSFTKMKKMETSGTLKEPWMKPGAKGLDNALKVRQGKVGGFRQELSEADIAFVNHVIQTRLSAELPYHEES